MACLRFDLNIHAEDYRAYYSGQIQRISVITSEGVRIEFPAEYLRPFVTHGGVHGRFEICFDDMNHLQSITPLP